MSQVHNSPVYSCDTPGQNKHVDQGCHVHYPLWSYMYHPGWNICQISQEKTPCNISQLRPAGQPETPSFPGPDRNRSGVGEHFKEYFRVGSGRVILFRVGPGRGILFRVGPGRGIFFTGVYDIFSRDFGDKLAYHSQTEEFKWLLSLISTLFDVMTSFQGIFTCLLESETWFEA